MNTPSAITRLYNELIRVTATTVVVPRIEEVLRRYREHPNIYYNERLGFKIFYPEGWIVDAGTGQAAGEQFDYLVNVSDFITILPDRNATFRPEIDLMVENIGNIDFMAHFHLRLNALNRNGIEVAYHLDEIFQVVTLKLRRTSSDRHGQPGDNHPCHRVTLKLKRTSSDRLLDFQIQKYFIRHGQAYNIIVRELDPVQMENEPELAEEIRQIVRSFAFVSKASVTLLNESP